MSTIVVVHTCQSIVCVGLVCLCDAQASYFQGSVHSPCSFCLFIPANMAGEELAKLVVGDDSGMYKAGFPGDDAPRAVPSDARHDGWNRPEGRKTSGITHSTTATSGWRPTPLQQELFLQLCDGGKSRNGSALHDLQRRRIKLCGRWQTASSYSSSL